MTTPIQHLPAPGPIDPPEVDARRGDLRRETSWRSVEATCADCGAEFSNSGSAASHARRRRHVVAVEYRSAFSFVPQERAAETTAASAGTELPGEAGRPPAVGIGEVGIA